MQIFLKKLLQFVFRCDIIRYVMWPVGQAAKTSPSHGENGGSIPPRVTKIPDTKVSGILLLYTFPHYNRDIEMRIYSASFL